jgi:hypothetical protein
MNEAAPRKRDRVFDLGRSGGVALALLMKVSSCEEKRNVRIAHRCGAQLWPGPTLGACQPS